MAPRADPPAPGAIGALGLTSHGFSVFSSRHLAPFHRSASVSWAPVTPTAMHRLTAGQEIPNRSLNVGLGAATPRNSQRVPFQLSPSVKTLPDGMAYPPTAWQPASAHATASRWALTLLAGVTVRLTAQAAPFQVMAAAATGGCGCFVARVLPTAMQWKDGLHQTAPSCRAPPGLACVCQVLPCNCSVSGVSPWAPPSDPTAEQIPAERQE